MITMNKHNILISIGIIFVLFASRVLPHLPNFTPIIAAGIYLTYFLGKKLGFIITLLIFILSDIFINQIVYKNDIFLNSDTFFSGLALLSIILFSSKVLQKLNFKNVFITAIVSSLIFFLISNFGSFLSMSTYPKTILGLIQCYIAGIPFISLPSDIFYSLVLYFIYSFTNQLYFSKHKILD
jgi:hypothetical protein